MSIAENLKAVRARIEAACRVAGRDPESVQLVAVSKFHEANAIREAYAEGQRLFGESYVQELAQKQTLLADLRDLEFHFVGHLQSNKVKALLEHPIACLETVHSEALVRELGKRVKDREKPLPVCIEVNVGREPNKHGALPEEVGSLVSALEEEPKLLFQGLMTIPPDDEARTRSAFQELAALREVFSKKLKRDLALSMGMSDDLEAAIAFGATHVRVGTAIFGARL